MAHRIKFNGTGDGITDSGIHFVGLGSDYTLCGITLDGDPSTAGDFDSTTKKVGCKQCIEIVEFSKKVNRNEYK